jgi:hypothetical protein
MNARRPQLRRGSDVTLLQHLDDDVAAIDELWDAINSIKDDFFRLKILVIISIALQVTNMPLVQDLASKVFK